MIETPKDGRIQVEKLKYPVEVLAYKLWLDPELVSRVDLKRMYTCQLYASNSSKYVSSLSSSKLPRNSTLVGKSWKTHPEISPKFQFPGREKDRFLENSSSISSKFQLLYFE